MRITARQIYYKRLTAILQDSGCRCKTKKIKQLFYVHIYYMRENLKDVNRVVRKLQFQNNFRLKMTCEGTNRVPEQVQ